MEEEPIGSIGEKRKQKYQQRPKKEAAAEMGGGKRLKSRCMNVVFCAHLGICLNMFKLTEMHLVQFKMQEALNNLTGTFRYTQAYPHFLISRLERNLSLLTSLSPQPAHWSADCPGLQLKPTSPILDAHC